MNIEDIEVSETVEKAFQKHVNFRLEYISALCLITCYTSHI